MHYGFTNRRNPSCRAGARLFHLCSASAIITTARRLSIRRPLVLSLVGPNLRRLISLGVQGKASATLANLAEAFSPRPASSRLEMV